MKYMGVEVSELKDADLMEASKNILQMHDDFVKRNNNPKYIEKMKNQKLPEANPIFMQLSDEITAELKKRNTHG